MTSPEMHAIDRVKVWAKNRGITLFFDQNLISFYVSLDVETMQIVLEPIDQAFRVDIWSLETADDKEFHHALSLPRQNLEERLDDLIRKAQDWLRTRENIF